LGSRTGSLYSPGIQACDANSPPRGSSTEHESFPFRWILKAPSTDPLGASPPIRTQVGPDPSAPSR
jgi:hypothetical protein